MVKNCDFISDFFHKAYSMARLDLCWCGGTYEFLHLFFILLSQIVVIERFNFEKSQILRQRPPAGEAKRKAGKEGEADIVSYIDAA